MRLLKEIAEDICYFVTAIVTHYRLLPLVVIFTIIGVISSVNFTTDWVHKHLVYKPYVEETVDF